MASLFGGLFEYETEENLHEFFEKIDDHNSYLIIELALTYAQKNGLFDFEESALIFKCLNVLKTDNKNEEHEQ